MGDLSYWEASGIKFYRMDQERIIGIKDEVHNKYPVYPAEMDICYTLNILWIRKTVVSVVCCQWSVV